MNNNLIVFKSGKMTITSLELVEQINIFRADIEGKAELRHDNLLQIIRDEFEDEINRLEIQEVKYTDKKGEKRPMYVLESSHAKQLLVRESKTVRKALFAYIERLEEIIRQRTNAEWLENRKSGKATRKQVTDVIMTKLIPHAESQGSKNAEMLYMTYSKLVNATLDIDAGQRDSLPFSYVAAIRFLENAIENIIMQEVEKGTHYKEIYMIAKVKCGIIKELSFLPNREVLAHQTALTGSPQIR